MYTATDLQTKELIRFRKLDALVKRLGGTDWQAEHESLFRPAVRTVMVLHKAYGQHAAWDVVTRVLVPSSAVSEGW